MFSSIHKYASNFYGGHGYFTPIIPSLYLSQNSPLSSKKRDALNYVHCFESLTCKNLSYRKLRSATTSLRVTRLKAPDDEKSLLNKLNIKSRHVYANTKIRFLRAWHGNSERWRSEGQWLRKITVEFKHPSKRCFIPSSSALLLPRCPYFFLHFFTSFATYAPTYARVQIFFPLHFLPFHLLPRSFTLSPLLFLLFSFFFFSIEFLFSLHSVVLNLRPSLDVSTRGLYCARLCPDNPLHSFKIVSRN